MNVLSLFDGISVGQYVLKQLNIPVENYYASEIDKYAISITQYHYPNTIQLGDINKIDFTQFIGKIDLIIGGSPCTQLSRANTSEEGKKKLDGKDSKLFYKFIEALEVIKPKYFLLENVKMDKESENIISEKLGVKSILINSSLVSAQKRERLYWTNIPNIKQPDDRNIFLKDVVFSDVYPVALHNLYGGFKEKNVRVFEDKSPTIRTAKGGGHIPSLVLKDLLHSEKAIEYMNRKVKDGRTHWDFLHHSDIRNDKSATVVANFFKGVPYNVFRDWNCIRKFHPIECEALQTLPRNYTEFGVDKDNKIIKISNTQRYKCIGNSWTAEVIKHIFTNLT